MKKFTFVRTLVFYGDEEEDAWEQLEEHLIEEQSDYLRNSWAIDPLESDTEED